MALYRALIILSLIVCNFAWIVRGGPQATGNPCDACGASGTWTETLIANAATGQQRQIVTSGCPNHYRYKPCFVFYVSVQVGHWDRTSCFLLMESVKHPHI